MPRTGVTRDQVFEAADALAQEGTQPTAKLVRDRTGGSFSTITPHLAAWKDERGGRGISNIPDMPESVANANWAVWAAAWNAAQDAIKTERDGLSAARRELEKERAEMASEIVELEAKLDASEGERASLAATLEAETKRHREAEEKMGDLKRSRTRAWKSASRTPRSEPTSYATRSSASRVSSRASPNRKVRPQRPPRPNQSPPPKSRPDGPNNYNTQAPPQRKTPPERGRLPATTGHDAQPAKPSAVRCSHTRPGEGRTGALGDELALALGQAQHSGGDAALHGAVPGHVLLGDVHTRPVDAWR
jgi:hypothetical protein